MPTLLEALSAYELEYKQPPRQIRLHPEDFEVLASTQNAINPNPMTLRFGELQYRFSGIPLVLTRTVPKGHVVWIYDEDTGGQNPLSFSADGLDFLPPACVPRPIPRKTLWDHIKEDS